MDSLSIVMSCYNEKNNLKRGVLEQLRDYLQRQSYPWEVIITDDVSTDDSYHYLTLFAQKNKNFKILKLSEKGGKPGGIWNSIQNARYPWVLMTDIDQSTPVSEISKFEAYTPKFDIIIGSRGLSRKGNSLLRRIGGPVFLFFRRLVILPDIADTQCGFKLFRTDVAKKLFPRLEFLNKPQDKSGWRVTSFDVELLFMAQKMGYQIKEVVVDWFNEDTSDTKGDSRFQKESVQMFKEIMSVKLNDLRGVYDRR